MGAARVPAAFRAHADTLDGMTAVIGKTLLVPVVVGDQRGIETPEILNVQVASQDHSCSHVGQTSVCAGL